MIRDMMVRRVEQWFGAFRASHPVQWLSDNGSIFAAYKTVEIAVAAQPGAGLHPGRKPGSNGRANAFVKTFKRDYIQVSPIPMRPPCSRRCLTGGL
jgi:putative transposase